MLRSFSYAPPARGCCAAPSRRRTGRTRARERFLEGYHGSVDASLLPPGQQATEQLLAVFELEKAVYELRYELNNAARTGCRSAVALGHPAGLLEHRWTVAGDTGRHGGGPREPADFRGKHQG